MSTGTAVVVRGCLQLSVQTPTWLGHPGTVRRPMGLQGCSLIKFEIKYVAHCMVTHED